jgi:hypothetical protein
MRKQGMAAVGLHQPGNSKLPGLPGLLLLKPGINLKLGMG